MYYVGSSDIGSYLITTPEGHVIIDGGYPETAPMIEAHVAQLEFKIADVKTVAYEVLNALDCHIFLGAHAGYYGGREKAATMREHPDGPNTFVDPEGYKRFIIIPPPSNQQPAPATSPQQPARVRHHAQAYASTRGSAPALNTPVAGSTMTPAFDP
ncbi:MAG: hypothetical protein DMG03_08420 [Acidobacteria bacterium]|nr:MAG: hypothetical protein DMG03_08420 [Acidobacteriota bacterium]